MAKGANCLLPNHPVVQQLKSQYGFNEDLALTAAKAVMDENPSLSEADVDVVMKSENMQHLLASQYHIGATFETEIQEVIDAYDKLVKDGHIDPNTGKVKDMNTRMYLGQIYDKLAENDSRGAQYAQTGGLLNTYFARPIKGPGRNDISQLLKAGQTGGRKMDMTEIDNAGKVDLNEISALLDRMQASAKARDLRAAAISAAKIRQELVPITGKTNKQINKLREQFDDPNKISFLVDHVCRRFTSALNQLISDETANRKFFGNAHANESFVNMSRNEIKKNGQLMTELLYNIIQMVASDRRVTDDKLNPNAKKELAAMRENPEAVAKMCYSYLMHNENLKINFDNAVESNESEQETSDINDDEINDPQDLGESDAAGDVLLLGKQEYSATSKCLPEVKSLINGIPNVDTKGRNITDPYGYNLDTYMDPATVLPTLYKWLRNVKRKSDMGRILERNGKAYPWVRMMLEQIGYQGDGKFDTTDAKKERLATQLFCSVRMSPTTFAESWTYTDRKGVTRYAMSTLNGRRERNRQFITTERAYKSAKVPILLDKNTVNKDMAGRVRGALNIVTGATTFFNSSDSADNIRSLIDEKGKLVNRAGNVLFNLKFALEQLGFKVSDKTLVSMALADVGSMKEVNQLVKDLKYILAKVEDFSSDNEGVSEPKSSSELFNPANKTSLNRMVRKVYEQLDMYAESETEPMVHSNGKNYAIYNFPTMVNDIVDDLKGINGSDESVKKFIEENYGKYPFYRGYDPDLQEVIYYSDILEKCLTDPSKRALLAVKTVLSHNNTEYYEQSDFDTYQEMLELFFGEIDNNKAWYKLNIAADKKEYAALRWERHNGTEGRHYISQRCHLFALQEINRAREVLKCNAVEGNIKLKNYDPKDSPQHRAIVEKFKKGEKITRGDLLDNDGRYVYRGSGLSFCHQAFLNDIIENPTTDAQRKVSDAIIDCIFNGSNMFSADLGIISAFHTVFEEHMDDLIKDEMTKFERAGLLDQGKLVEWTPVYESDGQRAIDEETGKPLSLRKESTVYTHLHSFIERYVEDKRTRYESENRSSKYNDLSDEQKAEDYNDAMNEMLQDFFYNFYVMKIETTELFSGDLAHYGNITNYQKRNAQSRASGVKMDVEATVHGERVSDGINRTITLTTQTNIGSSMADEIASALRTRECPFKEGTEEAKKWHEANEAQIKDILAEISEIDPTDGQTFTSLTGLRKKLAGRGEWSMSNNDNDPNCMTDEAVYRRALNGKTTEADLQHVFAQVTKPFNSGIVTKHRKNGTPNGIDVPVMTQHKNSEYALTFLAMYAANRQPGTVVEALFKYMEDTHYEDDGHGGKRYKPNGIDAVHFDSSVKVGPFATVDITEDMKPSDVITLMNNCTFESDGNGGLTNRYNNDYVHEMSFDGYMKQQIIPAHFRKHAQQMGSQERPLSIANVTDDETIKVRNADGTTTEMKGSDFKKLYFDKLSEKLSFSVAKARDDYATGGSEAQRTIALSKNLDGRLATSTRADFEDLQAIHLDSNGKFVLALEDPSHSANIQATLLSDIRSRIYKQMFNGGPVVQVTSWGFKNDLKIRFKGKNGESIIADRDAWMKQTGKTEEEYQKYLDENMDGIDYVEAKIPMTEDIKKLLTMADGSVITDFEEAKKILPPGMLEAIVYRIPTESAYSMFPIKVVGFTDENSGDAIQLPLELTKFAGFDFDIDKLFCMLKDFNIEKNGDTYKATSYTRETNAEKTLNNEIFDMQYSSMQSMSYFRQMSQPISIADISRHSYAAAILRIAAEGKGIKGVLESKAEYEKRPESKTVSYSKYCAQTVRKMDDKTLKKIAEANEQYDICRPSTDVALHRLNAAAKELIGIDAVNNISNAFFTIISDKVPISVKVGRKMKLFGREIGNYLQIDARLTPDGKPISQNVCKYIGAATDGAKEPALGRLGINKHIINEVQFQLRGGFSTEEADIFAAQPVIQRFIRLYERALNDGGFVNRDYIINSLELDIAGDEQLLETYRKRDINFTLDDAYERLARPENNPADASVDIMTLEALKSLSTGADNMQDISSITRKNSVNSGPKGDIAVFMDQQEKFQDIDDKLRKGSKSFKFVNRDGSVTASYADFRRELSFLYDMNQAAADLVNEILMPYFPSYRSNMYEDACDVISKYGGRGDITAETAQKIHDALFMYCQGRSFVTEKNGEMITRPALIDMSDGNTARHYLTMFVDHYQSMLRSISKKMPRAYAEEVKNNEFIKAIMIKSPDKKVPVPILRTEIGVDDMSKQKIKNAWHRLITSTHPEIQELGMELYRYFSMQGNGFGFHPQTPAHCVPLAAKRINTANTNRNEYFEDINFFSDFGENKDFAMQFLLNNLEDKSLVPKFNLDFAIDKSAITIIDDTAANEKGISIFRLNHIPGRTRDGGTAGILKPLIISSSEDQAIMRGIVKLDDDTAVILTPCMALTDSRGNNIYMPQFDKNHISPTFTMPIVKNKATGGIEFSAPLAAITVRRLGAAKQVIEYRPGMDITKGSVFENIDTEGLPSSSEVIDRRAAETNDKSYRRDYFSAEQQITFEDVVDAAKELGIPDVNIYFNKGTFNMNASEITKELKSLKNSNSTSQEKKDLVNAFILQKLGFKTIGGNINSPLNAGRAQQAAELIEKTIEKNNLC